MTSTLSSLLDRGRSFLGRPTSSRSTTPRGEYGFRKAADETSLFPQTDPALDGEDCDHDCESCTVAYPKKWSIDEKDDLFGKVNGWATVGFKTISPYASLLPPVPSC